MRFAQAVSQASGSIPVRTKESPLYKPKKKPEMTDEEIRKIWMALQDKDEWMRDSFLIALHTGCRLRETIIPLNCIDLAGETITFSAPKGGEEKAFSIPMPKALKPTFERMKANKRKVTLNMPFQPSRKMGTLLQNAGVEPPVFSLFASY